MPASTQCAPKTLWDLLPEELRLPRHRAVPVAGLTLDSRQVQPGYVFLADVGGELDGRRFIPQAIQQQCSAVVAEAADFDRLFPADGTLCKMLAKTGVPLVRWPGLKGHISAIAADFYDYPARSLEVVGVTGTNGKTTCTSLIAQLQTLLGLASATIGTLGYGVAGEELSDTGMTTPDAISLQRILKDCLTGGASHVAMEVSSHSLDQHRVEAANISIGVFTNLSRDHLDYHGDEVSYAAAKARLFSLPSVTTAVINSDDAWGRKLLASLSPEVKALSYGFGDEVDIRATDVSLRPSGVFCRITSPWGTGDVESPLFGEFNLHNVLAAIGVLCAQGAALDRILALVPRLKPVKGRMELLPVTFGPYMVVDYAHTPDALEKSLQALRHHCSGELWCVFGCGGDRDKGKRPLMARVAETNADHLVLTSDNPRTENPDDIIAGVMAGLTKPETAIVDADREQAISRAIGSAKENDLILIAGKGHEQYQLIAGNKLPFSDQEVALAAWARLKQAGGKGR